MLCFNSHRIWLWNVSEYVQVYLGCTYLSRGALDIYLLLKIQKINHIILTITC